MESKMSNTFCDAVLNNDIQLVETCLANEPQAAKQAMIAACSFGLPDVVGYLVNNRAVDMSSIDADSFLQTAAANGNLSVLKVFLEEDTACVFSHENLAKAIQRAAGEGELEVVRFLESRGGDINYDKDWALCLAVRFGHIDVVRFLLENKADATVRDNYPIRFAPLSNNCEILRLLLENGADVHVNNEEVLLTSVSQGNLDMVKLLVQKGADVTAVFDEAIRRTQLHPTRARNDVANYLRVC